MKGAIFPGAGARDLCSHCYDEGIITEAFKICPFCEEPFCDECASEINENDCVVCSPGVPEERGGGG